MNQENAPSGDGSLEQPSESHPGEGEPLPQCGTGPASPADDFAQGRWVVTIHSKLLGEKLYLVSDTVPEPTKPSRYAIYRASEIALLAGLPAQDLVHLHQWKKAFQGTFTSVQHCKDVLP
jgi:hypothetical protein